MCIKKVAKHFGKRLKRKWKNFKYFKYLLKKNFIQFSQKNK